MANAVQEGRQGEADAERPLPKPPRLLPNNPIRFIGNQTPAACGGRFFETEDTGGYNYGIYCC